MEKYLGLQPTNPKTVFKKHQKNNQLIQNLNQPTPTPTPTPTLLIKSFDTKINNFMEI